jgi:hypothetical protein
MELELVIIEIQMRINISPYYCELPACIATAMA